MSQADLPDASVSEAIIVHDVVPRTSDACCIPAAVALPVSPVIVELKDNSLIDECNSESNLSDCSESGVNIVINSVATEYAGRFEQQPPIVEVSSSENNEDYGCDQENMMPDAPVPYQQMPIGPSDLSYCSGCDVCTGAQSGYDINCQHCTSSAPYGFNNNNAHASPDGAGTIQVQYTPGADFAQPPQYQQQVVYAAPPCIQEQPQPIYFLPPAQAEEWVVANGYDTNIERQTDEYYNKDMAYQQAGQAQEQLEELPAIHISGAGLITILLKHDIAIEMTLDCSIRAINQRYNSVVSVNNSGRESCIFHKGVRISQKEYQVKAEMFHNRRVSMNNACVNFSFEDVAFHLERNLISPIPLSVFPEATEGDATIGMIYMSSGVHPHLIPAAQEAINDSRYVREKNGSTVVDINGVRVRQERNGDVVVMSTPKRIRLSPSTGWIGIQTDYVSMSIGEFWDVSIQCGRNVLSASNEHMFYVYNSWATAGFDINKKLFTYQRPDERHHFANRGDRRYGNHGMRPPPPRFMGPPPRFAGFGPRGPPMRGFPPHHPRMHWSGPRDGRKMYRPFYPPPPLPPRFRHQGYDRGGRRYENPNWRQRPMQPEPEEERPQSPDQGDESAQTEQTTETEAPTETEAQQPQPRKRMKNFKREQTRQPSDAESEAEDTN